MRLIDADKIDFNEVFKGESDFARDTREAAQMLINAQPTAFNVDKVVEQLYELGGVDGFDECAKAYDSAMKALEGIQTEPIIK